MGARRKARELAVQMLYQYDLSGNGPDTIIETFEAGIELRGTEVKSLRDSKAQLTDAYATVESGQLYLRNAHISIYDPGSYSNHEPTRTRRSRAACRSR